MRPVTNRNFLLRTPINFTDTNEQHRYNFFAALTVEPISDNKVAVKFHGLFPNPPILSDV